MKKFNSILLIICIFLIDLITKILVTSSMKLYASINVIDNFFYITYTKNRGAAFSILEGKRWFILIVSFALLIYLSRELFKKKNPFSLDLGLSLIIGGLISNLSDRLFLGYVRDFIDFRLFGHHFAIFNLGDVAIVIGCFIFFIGAIMEGRRANKSRK